MDEKEREEFRKGKKRLFFWLKFSPITILIGSIFTFMFISGTILLASNVESLGALLALTGFAGVLGVIILGAIYEFRIYYFFVRSLEKVDKKLDLTPDDLANIVKRLKESPESLAPRLIDAIEKLETKKQN
ncbi:MAG: hypothetical protein QXD54_05640 [Candidatus Aenigmatarchaeota archaeon]